MKKLSLKQIKDITKKSFAKKEEIDPEHMELLKNLDETKTELNQLNQSLNYITDPILLNQLIFQIKAAEVRYQYWFCMARQMKLENSTENMQTNV